jgi:hypothetical protein
MLRYAIAASAALMLFAGVASAEPVGPSTTTIRQSDHGTAITKRFINHRGEMVTKRKLINGNMVTHSRTVRDPDTGVGYTRSRTSTTE